MFQIVNPKRNKTADWNIYPYYAGFSGEFASTLINSANLKKDSLVLDPWNGSGTTVLAGSHLGFNTVGYDLNPVMVLISKANLLSYSEFSSLAPIGNDIINKAKKIRKSDQFSNNDPLNRWLNSHTVENIRKIDQAIQTLLIDNAKYTLLNSPQIINSLSNLASFYYVVLFRSLRSLLTSFKTSNPTWIKTEKESSKKLDISFEEVAKVYKSELNKILCIRGFDKKPKIFQTINEVGSSMAISLADETTDLVVTSPPYCTRIDYAVATLPELAILGFDDENFNFLRRNLIGTSTVERSVPEVSKSWGLTCNLFLENLYNHSSKASKSYYFKNHVQYFDSIYNSFSEISRVLKPNGQVVIVVQDSFYKEIHNDLAQVCNDMGKMNGLEMFKRVDFTTSQTMAGINSEVKKYRNLARATESVLCFKK